MSKNFLNLLATSVIVLSCGTAINCSSCYCMEDSIESTMDETNNISTNISQQDDSFNTINETRPNHNLQIHNIPVQNTFDSKELIATTEELFNNKQYYNKNDVRKEIKNYIRNIKEFYKSNDINTLKQLTKLVYTPDNNSFHENGTALCHHVKELQRRNIITTNEAQEILAFDLLVHIMTNVKYYNILVYSGDILRHYDSIDFEEDYTVDELQENTQYKDWVKSEYWDKRKYCATGLYQEIKNLICKLTKLLIPKYFVLDKPETWIPRHELTHKIKNYIRRIFKYFDSLPMVKNILKSENIKSTYSTIWKINEYSYISDEITRFFIKKNVRVKLTEEANKYFKYFQQAQIDRAHKESKLKDIKSKYILPIIGSYVGPNNTKKAAQSFYDVIQYAVPGGFYKPGTIPYIVSSYFMWL